MFRPVGSQLKLPQIEEKVLQWWKENKIFERSVENRKGGTRFTLYEGPPTANGSPGIHHVLSRIFKDIIPRHRAMKGYYTPRIGGWDTHGLPVELEVERELGLSSKTQIEEYGIAKFNARCRESVFRYLKDWNALTER
ncbi:MAG: class I tRNA ligase family protein, partial [Anaerolineales bacterium]|nr:class I tRNA ligase family protein [Anaerolineales bacterium]